MAIDLTPIIDAVETALTTEFAGTTLTFGVQSPTPANGTESVWCAVEFASYNYASTGIIYGLLTVNCFSHTSLIAATDLGDRAKTVLDDLTLAGVTAQPATTPRQVTRSGSLYQSRSTVSFTVQGLTISSFSPTQGSVGDAITIYGVGFTGAFSAAINSVDIDSFAVVSDGVITGAIATTTTTGKVTVTNGSGTGESLTDFVITIGGDFLPLAGGTMDSSAAIAFANGSKLQEGNSTTGLGGGGGLELECAVGYRLKWEAGRLYILQGDGITIRHSLFQFTTPSISDDETKGFIVGSSWTTDNNVRYLCTDASTGTWEIDSSSGSNIDLAIQTSWFY